MLRVIGGVIAGYVVMTLIVMAAMGIWLERAVPGGMKAARANPELALRARTPAYLTLNLTLSLIAALIGGWVAIRVSPADWGRTLLILAALIVVMAVASLRAPGADRQPLWYKFVTPLIGLTGLVLAAVVFGPSR